MNIKQYYKKIATVYLNLSIFSLVLSILSLILSTQILHVNHVWEVTIILMVYSCISFIFFHVYKKRFSSLPDDFPKSETSPLTEENVLLRFMPAPTLRILLFNPKGKYVGEVKDMNMSWYKWMIPNSLMMFFPQKYELIDTNGQMLATFNTYGFLASHFSVYNKEGRLIAYYKENWKKSLFRYNGTIHSRDHSIRMKIDSVSGFLYSFFIYSAADQKLASYQKGYMPLEWGERFKEMNIPVITFMDKADEDDKLCIYALCSKLLNYNNN